MPPAEDTDITSLLQALSEGKPGAADELVPYVYDALRALASRALRREAVGHTLQPTALVHEAYLLLVKQRSTQYQDRTHFFSIAARIMRRVLVDQARMRLASKRDGGVRVTLDASLASDGRDPAEETLDMIAMEAALSRLELLEARPARVVELRFFAGLDVDETARVLDISPASVKRDWKLARAFLKRELMHAGSGG